MGITEFNFLSGDGKTNIHAVKWECGAAPKAVVRLAHGMVEYIMRYDSFAKYLNSLGFVVYGNDHLGHGESVTDKSMRGYFGRDGGNTLVNDMHKLTEIAREENPGIPVILFGHSMGSFLTRRYLISYGSELDGAIICGTGSQPAIVLKAGKFIAGAIAAFKGDRYRSRMIDNLAFGGYNKAYEPSQTHKDWLCSDDNVVREYIADDRCTFMFTVNAYSELFKIIEADQKKSLIAKIPKDLPVYFIAGGDDPVGNMGKGVRKAYNAFIETGHIDTELKIYPGMRHEILNEIGKEEVFADIGSWLNKIIDRQRNSLEGEVE